MTSTRWTYCGRWCTWGAGEWGAAVELLDKMRQAGPDDLRASGTCWRGGQHEDGDRAAFDETFSEAERRGPPATAEEWFFRGLAIHWEQPAVALESYRQANALRAAEHEFFPQALLHLARARNQQLYATRSIDALADAQANLRLLIDNGYYGAYPYYLLSISQRLAAEVYRGSSGTRGDLADQYYAEALKWARLGQEIDPDNDRPITAEGGMPGEHGAV